MKTYTFKTPLKYIPILAYDIKQAFLKLALKARKTFTEVHCDETGELYSDVEVYGLFGHEIAL